MKDFMTQFPAFHGQLANNYFGPRSNRQLKKTGYAQFVDTDTRDLFFLQADGKSFFCKGAKVTVRKGLAKWYRHRDYVFGEAKKALTKHFGSGENVEYKKVDKVRTLVGNSETAFEQKETDFEGRFVNTFSALSWRA